MTSVRFRVWAPNKLKENIMSKTKLKVLSMTRNQLAGILEGFDYFLKSIPVQKGTGKALLNTITAKWNENLQ